MMTTTAAMMSMLHDKDDKNDNIDNTDVESWYDDVEDMTVI
jgi:hypothetical protein